MAGNDFGPISGEEDWLNSADPEAMERFLQGRDYHPRLWRLFACACCWRVLPMLDDRSRQAFAVAERHAERLASFKEFQEAAHLAHLAVLSIWQPGKEATLQSAAMAIHRALVRPKGAYIYAALATGSGADAERRVQADLLRDVFGNPFRAVAVLPRWRTKTVLAIAEDIYHNDTFAEMPVLGDALEDAGCDDRYFLDNARQPSPHVRGCWLVDGLLAKTPGVVL